MSECITCRGPVTYPMWFCTPRCSRLHYAFKYVCERARSGPVTPRQNTTPAAKPTGQSRLTSLLETLNRSIISGTSAAALHYTTICWWFPNECGTLDLAAFSTGMFGIMFLNSVCIGYLVRRTYERYGVQLDARSLWRRIRGVSA